MSSQIGHINLVNYLTYLLCLFNYLPTYVLHMTYTYLASTYLPTYLFINLHIYIYLLTYLHIHLHTYLYLHNQVCTFKTYIGRHVYLFIYIVR
jgi:hypothetical protein